MRRRVAPRTRSQRGAALLLFTLIFGIAALSAFLYRLNSATQATERDQITSDALGQAKDALIGYAASVPLTGTKRPGDLPCPDVNNDGIAEASCGNATGSTGQNLRLGRLPWKTLGLPDLRDGSGERLWYAVSNNFKNNTRTICTSPGMTGCLNSDTIGTITVRDSTGVIVNNGADSTAAIAVIIGPGSALKRQDGVNQVRDAANVNVPANYLDIGNGEDNAAFVDGGTDGFINGIAQDAANNLIVNDRVLAITADDLMPILGKRVAAEALICLTEYSTKPQNKGRYPWAAALNPAAAPSYADTSGNRFGRMPDTLFVATRSDSGNVMDDSWTGNCNINSTSGWWLNWKEHVFYAVADAYKPAATLPTCGGTGTCLVVNPPSATANKQVAVFVAGRRLSGVAGGQPRSDANPAISNLNKGTIANYLEGENATSVDDIFSSNTSSPIFNDHVLCR
jgi:type II secretory pathway pseudopilin PulG